MTSKPPFKNPSLPQPGASGRRRVLELATNELGSICVATSIISLVGGLGVGLSLGRTFGRHISNAALWAIVGACMAVIGIVCFMLYRRVTAALTSIDREALGIEGERVVADELDDLKRMGFRVIHDVPPEREGGGEGLANFDHVVIGPTGVFVIETKTRSKHEGRDNKIVVTADGRVLMNGFEFDRCPITQAKTLRDAMKAMLERQTSLRNIFVRGVAMFPASWIEDDAYRKTGGDIWTLNPRAFKTWATNGRDPVRLSGDDIALLASRIEDHCRTASLKSR